MMVRNEEIQMRVDAVWEAFREKKPPRCEHRLRQGGRFCFLGYMTDFFMEETHQGQWVKEDVDGELKWFFRYAGKNYAEYPPVDVTDWFGMTPGQTLRLAKASDKGRPDKELFEILQYGYVKEKE